MTPLAVEITNLHKRYDSGTVALKGIDLAVPVGQFFGLLGPNGAGKTTTIAITTGLVRITAGRVKVMDYDVITQFRDARKQIGVAAQELNFDWFFTIRDLMILQAGYYGVPRKVAAVRANRLLKEFGLAAKANVKTRELSGGMKRRFQIARSLVHDPDLLILDEPTAGVDVELRHMLWDYLRDLNDRGKTIILTTHYIEEAEKLCERVAIIDQGKIIAEGSPSELTAGMNRAGLHISLDGWSDKVSAALSGFQHEFTDGKLLLRVARPETRLAEIISIIAATGASVVDISICRATLEDVFVELTGHALDA